MHKHVRVVHHVPGRVRLKVPHVKGSRSLSKRIEDIAGAVPGVHSVEASPITGSVVVRYDKNDPRTRERLKRALDDMNTLLSIALPEVGETQEAVKVLAPDLEALAGRFPATRGIIDSLKASDRKVKQASGGVIDLKTLFPLAVAGSMFFLDAKSKPLILGTLGLISLHSFVTLHEPAAASR